jgi:hypothetical protein
VPFTVENLAIWLGAVGAGTGRTDASPAGVMVEQLYAQELERKPDPAGRSTFVAMAEGGVAADDMRRNLRSSLERFVRRMPVRGVASTTFRELLAVAELHRLDVPPPIVAECIAAYQYSLGRPPDIAGFEAFAAARRRASLLSVVAPIAKSAEAVGHHAPHKPPSVDDVARHAAASVVPMLDAAGTDITLERVVAMEGALAGLHDMIGSLARQVERIEQLLTLHIGTSSHP